MKRLVAPAIVSLLLCAGAHAAPKQPPRGVAQPYGPTIKHNSPTVGRHYVNRGPYAPNGPVAGGTSPVKTPTSSVHAPRRSSKYPDRFGRNGTTRLPGVGHSQVQYNASPGFPKAPYASARPGRTEDRGEYAEPDEKVDGETLAEALEAISKAWKEGDAKELQSRFPIDRKIGIFQYGKHTGESPGRELGRQVAEGVTSLKTISFKLETTKDRTANRGFATGAHVFSDLNQQRHTAYVSYALERISSSRWQIVEYGWSDKPVAAHTGAPVKEEAFGPASEKSR